MGDCADAWRPGCGRRAGKLTRIPRKVCQTSLTHVDSVLVHLRRLWLLVGWLLVFAIVYLSLTPVPIELPVKEGDKLGHGIAYLVLMSWFANLYEGRRQHAWCAAGCVALAIALEFAQRWTSIRSYEVLDMLASAAGVGIAWVLAPPRLPNYLRMTERFCLSWLRR